MKTFRSVIFWLHLAAGLVAGTVIGIMCFTGATLAFEDEIIAWAERDARHVAPPEPMVARRPLADLLRQAREARPETRPTALAVSADPRDTVAITFGRDDIVYANPYTGKALVPASTGARDFMRVMTDWHRTLAQSGDNRPIGKAINDASNVAFLILAVSGLYLWMPRRWSWASVKAVAFFNWRLAGKARDFNWHNTVGLWCAPVLIGLTLTALPLSYRWAGNLVYQLAGEEAPAAPGPGAAPAVEFPAPPAGARPLNPDALFVAAQPLVPGWETLTLRLAGGAGGRGGGRRPAGTGDTPRANENRPAIQPAVFTVKLPGAWPRTATTTLTLNPYTGAELKREGFGDLSAGRQARSWMRFLHTGQALGWIGQLVAGLACVGGCVLVYTGFALGWRRLFGRKNNLPEQ